MFKAILLASIIGFFGNVLLESGQDSLNGYYDKQEQALLSI